MKPIPFKIPKSKEKSLRVQIDQGPYFYDQLHYHPEFQISAIRKGQGILYAGNGMVQFKAGDVFMIGANVPHLLKNTSIYYSSSSPGVDGVSLFFDFSTFGNQFFELAETASLKRLLHQSRRVLKVKTVSLNSIFHQVVDMEHKREEEIIIGFLNILSHLKNAQKSFINSNLYQFPIDESVGNRLNAILEYSFQHLQENISIEAISKVAHLSRSQFSRYFKAHTGKTYIEFLNELRVETACSYLHQNHQTIEQICYEVGFQNISNFNRQFKKIKQTTPSAYRSSRVKWK